LGGEEPEVAKRKSNLEQEKEDSREITTQLPVPSSENNNVTSTTDVGLEMTESMTASTLTESSLMQFNRDIESMMDQSALEPKEDFTQNLS
jgi:hypothetical protein